MNGPRAPRILTIGNMYPPLHLGGYEIMWRSWVEHCRSEGSDVRVVTTDYRAPDAPGDESGVHRDLRWYWRDHQFPRLSPRKRIALERHNASVLGHHLDEFAPDVVAWWAMGGMSLSMLEQVRRAGCPAIGVVVDDWLVYGPKVDAWLRLARSFPPRLAERLSGVPARVDFAGAAQWVFVSRYVERKAREAGVGIEDGRIANAGIEEGVFSPGAPREDWAGRLLCLGRIDPRKGADTAIRALADLPRATLRVVGSGDNAHLADLHSLADEAPTRGRVTFETMPRSDVPQAMREADALLFPVAWEEPWGLVPLEAMGCGTPVIATGAGGSGEYLRHEENCLIFQPRRDAGALAAQVERLAQDPDLRRTIRERGFETAQRFTERAFNEAVLDEAVKACRR